MNGTCNIYHNRLTDKWEFYEVINGKESIFHLIDLKGLEEGDGSKISLEHLTEINRYFNMSEIDINIYEDDPIVIADIQNPKEESIHIKILPNKFIHKKVEEVEILLQEYFPNIILLKFTTNKDEETIHTISHVISIIKSTIDKINERVSIIDQILYENQESIKNTSKSDIQQYKYNLIQCINKLMNNIIIDDYIKLFFNKCVSSDLEYDTNRVSEFLKKNLKSIEDIPVVNSSNPTFKEIQIFVEKLLEIINHNDIMRYATTITLYIKIISFIFIYIKLLHDRKNISLKNMQLMQNFWKEFCIRLKDLITEQQSTLMKSICICSTEKAYSKLAEAENIIDSIH